MRIPFCVYGEGRDDYGHVDPTTGEVVHEGCYVQFLRRVASGRALCCLAAGRAFRKLPGRKRPPARLKHFALQAYYATREAIEIGALWVVIGADADARLKQRPNDTGGRTACRGIREEFEEGYRAAISTCPDTAGMRLVRIVPLSRLESWLLGDPAAFHKVTGRQRPKLPYPPERLWGKQETKDLLRRFAPQASKPELARAARPRTLARNCPISYPLFQGDVH